MFKVRYLVRWNKVRGMCIRDNLYTMGSNSEYEHLLFDLINDEGHEDLADIETMARDILDHSDLDRMTKEYSIVWDELVLMVMNNILNDCTYTIIERED